MCIKTSLVDRTPGTRTPGVLVSRYGFGQRDKLLRNMAPLPVVPLPEALQRIDLGMQTDASYNGTQQKPSHHLPRFAPVTKRINHSMALSQTVYVLLWRKPNTAPKRCGDRSQLRHMLARLGWQPARHFVS